MGIMPGDCGRTMVSLGARLGNMTAAVILALLLTTSLVQQGLSIVDRSILTVYRDGIVNVYIEASVDELEPYIILPLFSSRDKIDNVLAMDEEGEVLDYDYGENNTIIVYTLGARLVRLEYDTSGLTSMEHGLWTIKFTAPFNLTIILPEGSTIIYINRLPEAIKPRDGRIELTIGPGEWEITYEIPITPPTRPPSQQPTPTPPVPPTAPITWDHLHYIIVGVCVICAALITAIIVKRGRLAKGLSDEEAEVLRFIRERGGRALEAELRERFPYIPRTTMWRLIRRLEKKGIVRVRKVGLQNLVELK